MTEAYKFKTTTHIGSNIIEEGEVCMYNVEEEILDHDGTDIKVSIQHLERYASPLSSEGEGQEISEGQPLASFRETILTKLFQECMSDFIDEEYPKGAQLRGSAMLVLSQFWSNSDFREELLGLLKRANES